MTITWSTEQRKLSDLIPWPRNPRKINDTEAKRLVESFDEFGQVETIAIGPANEVYNGHQRLRVLAGEHGPDTVVDVRVASRALTEKEREKLTVYLHRGAAGAWDFDTLLAEFDMGELVEWGFEQSELDAWGEGDKTKGVQDPGPQVDRAEELQTKWQTATGQIWRIGEHVVICGDCRDADTWQRLLSAAGVDKVNGVFTSPPYAEQRKEQYGGVPTGEYVDWWESVQVNVRSNLATDGSFFVNIKPHTEDGERSLYVADLVLAMSRRWSWSFVDEFCWLRGGVPREVKYNFKNGFEPVYHFAATRKGFKFRPDDVRHESDSVPIPGGPGVGNTNRAGKQGQSKAGAAKGRTMQGNPGMTNHIFGTQEIKSGLAYPSNVLKANSNDEALGHQAAFPVALPDFFIRAYSDSGDVWLDPFLGSGTTIVAAHQNNRRGLGIEMLPKYVAVILERLWTSTEQEPVLLSQLNSE